MKTGILFDLDGTLLDTLADLTDATNYTLAQFGYPQHTIEEIRRIVGNGAHRQMTLAAPEGADVDALLAVYKPYYDSHSQIKTGAYAGIEEALAELGCKYPLAIVSNKPDPTVKSLCAKYFPGLYARGESADCPRKPAPDMVFKAMEAIGVESCIYVGDSEVDVLTAQNAGVPCVSVLWGFRDREEIEAAGGKYFCETTAQLIETIEELTNGK